MTSPSFLDVAAAALFVAALPPTLVAVAFFWGDRFIRLLAGAFA